jgi:hypothetical protein
VLRPDGVTTTDSSQHLTGPYSVTITSSLDDTTDDAGGFTAVYQLDGITGTYTVNATDGVSSVTMTFTDAIQVTTTTTLNAISDPLISGQTGISFSGSVSSSPTTSGGNVELQAQKGPGNNWTTIATVAVSSGNFSGTFDVPALSSYPFGLPFQAAFMGHSDGTYKWNTSKSATQTATVYAARLDQTITFLALANKTYGDAPFTISATASSGLPVSFAITAGSTHASLSGSTVTITGAGSVTITASQAGNGTYNPAPDVSRSFTINPKAASVTANNKSKTYGDDNPALTATVVGEVAGGDAINYSLSTTAVKLSGVGDYPITVTLGSNPNYNVTPTDGNLHINAKDATVTADPKSKTYGNDNPTLTATVVGEVAGGDAINYSLSTLATKYSTVGDYTITVTLGSNPNYNVTKTDGNLRIEAKATSLTVTASGVQYSDQTTLIATISPVSLGGQTNSGSVQFSIDGEAVGPPVAVEESGGTATLLWTITKAPGTYSVSAAFTHTNPNFTDATNTCDLEVTQEDAAMTFDPLNPVSVIVHDPNGDNSAFSWKVTITQDDDGHLGLLSKIVKGDIKLSFKAVGSGGGYDGGYDLTASSFDPITGIATFNVPTHVLGVETYSAAVTLTNVWFTAIPVESVLVVYDPSLGFITGGGWFYWPADTSNHELQGAKVNFGFTMKYNKNQKNPQVQGSLLLIAHLPEGGMIRIKSNSLYGLAITSTTYPGIASFSGKCTYTRTDAAGNVLASAGNQEFTVYVRDMNEPGTGSDMFWFTTKLTIAGEAPFSLDRDGGRDADEVEYVLLRGGNIVVPHTRSTWGK